MKFAHFSDIHLGFQKSRPLQDIEQDVFERALDDCIRRSVDFILVCGDTFHVNIPEMRVQKFAFAALRRVHEAGIPVYAIYGSHDFSPSATSVIDLLVETGYITNIQRLTSNDDGTMSLGFVTDEKTGAKLAGISGLGASKDITYYKKLQLENLESASGFKIFLFHGAIFEMRNSDDVTATEETAMSLSYMPRGFDYYAGGHMHGFRRESFENYPYVVYPGTLFAGFHSDLEANANEMKRGYVLVEFDRNNGVISADLIVIPNCQYEIRTINATHKRSDAVNEDIAREIRDMDPADKVIILKVEGKMSEGKTTDIDFKDISDGLFKNDAVEVKISRNKLSSAEYEIAKPKGDTAEEISENTFRENIGQVDSVFDELKGQEGVDLAKRLLDSLGQPPLENEPSNVYRERITGEALAALGLMEEEEEGEKEDDS